MSDKEIIEEGLENKNEQEEYQKGINLDYFNILIQMKVLLGEVLTITEASISDEVQLYAVKRLIKGQFSNRMDWVHTLCKYPEITLEEELPSSLEK